MTAKKTAAPASKEAFLAKRIPEDTVETDLGTVKVRGMSRGEMFAFQKVAKDHVDFEQKVLSRCMLEPAMNEEEVHQWVNASVPSEIAPIVAKIMHLSGLDEGADKS